MFRRLSDYSLISLMALTFAAAFAIMYLDQQKFGDELSAYFDTSNGLYDEPFVDRTIGYLSSAMANYRGAKEATAETLDAVDLAYAYLNIGDYIQAYPCVQPSLQHLDNLRKLFSSGSKDFESINRSVSAVLSCTHLISSDNLTARKRLTHELLEKVEVHRYHMNLAIVLSYIVGLFLWWYHERQRINTQKVVQEKRSWQARAMTDPLTGTLNRGALDEYLSSQIDSRSASGQSLGLIMYDIDHFKSYNDLFGHTEGDRVLKKVCQAVQRELRPLENQFRYGGEEFVVTTDVSDLDQLKSIARRLLKRVQDLEIPHPRSESGYLTISLGLIISEGNETSAEELLKGVDKQLYRAKSAGRNQINHA